MENNNDNNLFTNMFGIESEEPKEQIQPEPTPQPVVENNVMEQPQQPTPIPQPVTEQKTIVEEIITLDSNKPTFKPQIYVAPNAVVSLQIGLFKVTFNKEER